MTDRAGSSLLRGPESERGAAGWFIVGIIVGVVLVIWLIVQLFQAVL